MALQAKALSSLPGSQRSDCRGGRECYNAFPQVYFEGKARDLRECIFQGVQQDRKEYGKQRSVRIDLAWSVDRVGK